MAHALGDVADRFVLRWGIGVRRRRFFFEYKQLAVRDSGGGVEKLTAKPLLHAAICNKSRSLRQSRCYMQLFAAIRSV